MAICSVSFGPQKEMVDISTKNVNEYIAKDIVEIGLKRLVKALGPEEFIILKEAVNERRDRQ